MFLGTVPAVWYLCF